MNRLHQAEAAAREALHKSLDTGADAARWVALEVATHNLLAALAAARGEAVGEVEQTHPMMGSGFMHTFTHKQRLDAGTKLFAAPPAALAVPDGLRNAEQTLALLIRKYGDEADAAALAMLAQQPAAAVPEGYALVPVEPTQKMVEIGAGVIYDNGGNARWADIREAWSYMLAAAERAPEAPKGLHNYDPAAGQRPDDPSAWNAAAERKGESNG